MCKESNVGEGRGGIDWGRGKGVVLSKWQR